MNEQVKYNILYVDDEKVNLRVFKNLFKREFNIYTVESGEEGLDLLDKEEIHLVITDQRMPTMSGLEFMQRAKIKLPDVPYILLTGYTDHEVLKDAVNEIGIFRYINKPFDNKIMGIVINMALEVYQLRMDKDKFAKVLAVSEEKFRGIYNSIMDVFTRVDNDGIVQLVSPSVATVFGYKPEELIGKEAEIYYEDPEDRKRLIAVIKKDGFCNNFEYTVLAKDGSRKIVSTNAKPYLNEKGERVGIESIIRDISSKKLLEQQLEISHYLLNESQKIAHLGHIKWEIATNKLNWSDEAYRIYGVNPKIVPDFDFTIKLVHPDDLSYVQDNLELAVQAVRSFDIEYRIMRADNGKVIWVHSQAKIEIDDEGNPLYLIGTILDITNKKRNEQALKQSEEEFRLLAESAPNMILKVNNKFEIEYINRAIFTSVGEILGKSMFSFIPDEEHTRIKKEIRGVFLTGKPTYYEAIGQSPVGTEVWYGTNVGAVIKDNKIESALLVVEDISEKKNAVKLLHRLNHELEEIVEQRTKELEKAKTDLEVAFEKEKELGELKSRFVATASHQFRTPLTVIQSSMAILDMQKDSMDNELKPRFEKAFNTISGQISRMTDLMNDVLILGKINSSAIKPVLIYADLVELCEEVIINYNEIQTDSRKMRIKVKGKPYKLELDIKLMEHAISNLISNSFKYSVGRTAPEITISFSDKKVEIIVKDNGIGIPQEEIKHLFEPFYRASNVEEEPGTGLGTVIVKEYVELNKGSIEVKSKLNIGTEFIVTFKN